MNAARWKDCEYVAKPSVNGHANGHKKAATQHSKKSAQRWFEFKELVETVGPKLSASEFRVCVLLFERAHAKSRQVQISHSTIATLTGISTRQVVRIIESLVSQKVIQVVKRGSNVTDEANVYRYTWSA